MSDNKLYLIVMDGDYLAGVEAIFARHTINDMEVVPSTVVQYYKEKMTIDGDEVRIHIENCHGYFYSKVPNTFLKFDGYMSVYDITSREMFEESKSRIRYVSERNREIKIILVGSKCDLERKRKVSYEEAHSFSRSEGILFIETSALCSINIDEAFNILAREIHKAKLSKEAESIKIVQPRKETRSNWCY